MDEFEAVGGLRVAVNRDEIASVHEYHDDEAEDIDDEITILVSLKNGVELQIRCTFDEFMDRTEG
jgi:hypothetical protein